MSVSSASSDADAAAASSMSSRKRPRATRDVDGDVEIESASSNLRHVLPKRSRLAVAAENGGSVVSDDDDEIDGVGYDDDDGDDDDDNLTTLEYSLPPDGDFNAVDSGDDETDEIRATQMVQKQMRTYEENMASEQGVIEEVFCRNFMCHAKLRIKLGPLINFIIGHNGSGKSAVLTALTMCLGGRATATNRGTNLKSLIKEGEDNATLAVKIKNRGDDAYKPELYGNSITVERHFTRNGASSFKLRNAADKVISTKKGDLDDLLDYYAFQLDNPINVLTQDMARQFLSNSTPADKYKFFIRGTQLETLDNDYKILEEHLDNIIVKLANREEDLDVLKAKKEEAERRKKRLDDTRRLQETIDKYRHQHAWAQVEEQEATLEWLERDVEESEERVREKEHDAEAITDTFDRLNEAHEAAQRHVEELKEQLAPAEAQRDADKDRFAANTADLANVNAEHRTVRDEMKKLKAKEADLEGKIKEEQDRIAGAEGAEYSQRLAELDELGRRAEAAKQAQLEHQQQYADLSRTRDEAFREHEAVKPALQRQQEEVHKAKLALRRLETTQGRPFDGYRQNMDQLVRAVNNETRWRSKPVGPMGKHVRLRADKTDWSSQIEKTFGGTLDSFVVTNTEDHRLLRGVMQRVRCEVPILIGDPAPLDTTGKEPDDPNVDTILRVLSIDNDLVRNQLIISQAIEQVCLIANGNEAIDFLFGLRRPRNVRAAISFVGERGAGIRYEYTRSGAQKSSPIGRWDGVFRIQTDREQQVRMQRENVRQAERDADAAMQQVREKDVALAKANQNLTRFDREAKQLKTRLQEAEDAIEEQNNLIESGRPQDGRLQELERQLAEVKSDYEYKSGSYQDAVNAKDGLNEKARELKAALDTAQKQVDQNKARVARAENQMQQAQNKRHAALLEKNQALEAIDFAKRSVDQVKERRDSQRHRVEEFTQAANVVSRRVPVEEGLTRQILDDRIEKLTQDISRQEREAGGTPEELVQAWKTASLEYAEAKAAWNTMEKFKKTLSDSLGYRRYRWEKFRRYIALRARSTFRYLLSERNFRGNVQLNHTDKLLDISVEPDLSRKSDSGREAKTLSGGEKSFSTICLLLSIWDAMGSPIRCLDEFDVFMDNVNRAASMSMMIQAARRSVGRQFILITPQSMNNVEMGDDVKVHKMSDPERGQTVLPFTQG